MNDIDISPFIEVACQHGSDPEAAQSTFDMLKHHLGARCHPNPLPTHFYVYRNERSNSGTRAQAVRPRMIAAFPNADAAIAFAQQRHLAPLPRLASLTIAQLLTMLLQHATIGSVLFADDPVKMYTTGFLPSGLRLERTVLLGMLREE